jgi:putative nucleotidyltransferase with HDIG domain
MDKTDIQFVQAGRILAAPLCTANGAVILAKGVVLTDSIIIRLQRMGITELTLQDASAAEADPLKARLERLDRRFARHHKSEIMMCIRDGIAEQLFNAAPPPIFTPAPGTALLQENVPIAADQAAADRLRDRILRTLRIQTLPDSVHRMSKVLDDPASTLSDVSREIERDPALASQVLKLVNSGFYGLRGRVSSIQHAGALLGFNTLRTVLLSASMHERMNGPLESLWNHSVACSRISSLISRTLGIDDPEEAGSAGLLHDIGKTILFECVPEEFQQSIQIAQQNDTLSTDAEKHLLRMTHEETGALLLNKWNIPEPSVAAVAFHHHPDQAGEHKERATLVHVADVLIRAWGIGLGDEQHIPTLAPEAMGTLNLSTDSILQLVGCMEQELRDIV